MAVRISVLTKKRAVPELVFRRAVEGLIEGLDGQKMQKLHIGRRRRHHLHRPQEAARRGAPCSYEHVRTVGYPRNGCFRGGDALGIGF